MTGKVLLDNAVAALGFTYSDDINRNAVVYINMVGADIASTGVVGYEKITNLTDKIDLPDAILNDVAVYGLAMWIAFIRGDGEKNQVFAAIYNRKRSQLTRSGTRKDVLPTVEG